MNCRCGAQLCTPQLWQWVVAAEYESHLGAAEAGAGGHIQVAAPGARLSRCRDQAATLGAVRQRHDKPSSKALHLTGPA